MWWTTEHFIGHGYKKTHHVKITKIESAHFQNFLWTNLIITVKYQDLKPAVNFTISSETMILHYLSVAKMHTVKFFLDLSSKPIIIFSMIDNFSFK